MDDIASLLRATADLPPDVARRVLAEIEGSPAERNPRVAVIRRALAEAANRSRSQHARRLFTSLWEPFLCGDGLLLSPTVKPVGVIHRFDIGGLWHYLAERPLRDLAASTQRELAELAADEAIDKVLLGRRARIWRERLSAETQSAISHVLAREGRTNDCLAAVNAWRQREARKVRLGPVRPLGAGELALYRDILQSEDVLQPLLVQARSGPEGMRQALGQFASVVAVLGGRLRGERLTQTAALFPLVLMHDLQAFWVVPQLVALDVADDIKALGLSAFAGHVALACRFLAAHLVHHATVEPHLARVLAPAADVRQAIASHLARLDVLLRIHAENDLSRYPAVGRAVGEELDHLTRGIGSIVLPALMKRLFPEEGAMADPERDHEGLVWFLGFIEKLRRTLQRHVMGGGRRQCIRDYITSHLRDAFQRTFRDAADGAPDATERLGRIEELAQAVGETTTCWVDPLSRPVQACLLHRMEAARPLTAFETRLIAEARKRAEDEIAKVKYWKDPALVAFVDAAKRRVIEAP